jgi:hypothetical protein
MSPAEHLNHQDDPLPAAPVVTFGEFVISLLFAILLACFLQFVFAPFLDSIGLLIGGGK